MDPFAITLGAFAVLFLFVTWLALIDISRALERMASRNQQMVADAETIAIELRRVRKVLERKDGDK